MKKFAAVVVSLATAVVVWAQAPPSKQVEIFGQKIQYMEAIRTHGNSTARPRRR